MAIIRSRNRVKIILFSFLICTIFTGLISTSNAASTNYAVALNKGTQTYLIEEYDEEEWEDVVDDILEPDDYFDGDSDEVGAKSRITIRNVASYKWDLFDALISIIDILSYIPDDLPINNVTLILIEQLSKDYVDDTYPDKYNVWESFAVKWDFETEEFDETPDESEYIIPIFKDPGDLKDILEDYNNWALKLNLTMISLGLEPFPILDGDDFLWLLITSGMLAIASPFEKYLISVIEELDTEDAKVKENTLILERNGKEDYTVEMTFNDQGFQSNLVVKKDNGRVIFEIAQDDTDIIGLIVAGITAPILVGTAVVFLIKRKKLKK